jgi:2-polyprenyl-6-methoxyphenol hydroxylase-like FAD-dependent oxidoreductase
MSTGRASTGSHLGDHAVVIGGSVAGLMTARVLADHFAQVTILERDRIEDGIALHKSIPQGNHAHGLMLGGQQVMARLYPGFTNKLLNLGAVAVRVGVEFAVMTPNGKAYSFGGAVKEPRDLGLKLYEHTRALLESCIRQCTLESANVVLRSECAVQGLIARDRWIRGVTFAERGDLATNLEADFVVDAGGRGSQTPRWLKELGFAAPEETSIGVDFAYSTTTFRVRNYDQPERAFYAFGPGPDFPKMGFLAKNEGGVWLLSIGGRFGDYPPTDEDGFLAFTKSLHTPQLYEIVKDAERLSEIRHYRYPISLRRHYEQIESFPEGYAVLGDALASFNPLYAQGMTSAALQAEALQALLHERAHGTAQLQGLSKAFRTKAAEVVSVPWTMAAHSDFAYPQTKGDRPAGLNDGDQYLAGSKLSAPTM